MIPGFARITRVDTVELTNQSAVLGDKSQESTLGGKLRGPRGTIVPGRSLGCRKATGKHEDLSGEKSTEMVSPIARRRTSNRNNATFAVSDFRKFAEFGLANSIVKLGTENASAIYGPKVNFFLVQKIIILKSRQGSQVFDHQRSVILPPVNPFPRKSANFWTRKNRQRLPTGP